MTDRPKHLVAEQNPRDSAAGSDPVEAEQIRRARGKFLAMAGAYSLGAFNDNFFKQAACLLAISINQPELQGYAAAVFTLPFILLAAPAGWLSDRFPKRRIVIAAKCLEVCAMTCGAIGICLLNWPLILVMIAAMGLHSTIFGPALNGSIPELYPAGYIIKANSLMKMATTMAILVGIVLAGLALGRRGVAWGGVELGRATVAAAVLGTSVLGLLVSLGVPRRPAASPEAKFPWTGPIDTVKVLLQTRKDPLLAMVIWIDAFVWGLAALQVLIINKMGKTQLGLDEAATSYLVVSELAGVAVGGLLCGRIASSCETSRKGASQWTRVLAPAMLLLGASMGLLALAPMVPEQVGLPWGMSARMLCIVCLLLPAGLAGGMLLVPLESFIQARPQPQHKGQIIAAGNFAAFGAILIAGLLSVPLNLYVLPTSGFGILAVPAIVVAAMLPRILRKSDQEVAT